MPSSHFCDGKAITSGSSASAASRSAPTDCAPSTIVMIFAARARGKIVSSGRMRPLSQLTHRYLGCFALTLDEAAEILRGLAHHGGNI
jgi:hypothetical protein